MIRSFVRLVTSNLISLFGTALTTSSAVIFIIFFGADLRGINSNPYFGLITFFLIPALFVAGLILIPFGIWLSNRNAGLKSFLPKLGVSGNRKKQVISIFALLTLVNFLIIAVAAYKGHRVMDSASFCGTTCHVMEPEHVAYLRSAHARVPCVECHVGSGAESFVRSKFTGAWQLVSISLKLYPKPIVGPVHNLRPAQETCEHCHWPEKFTGDRLKIINRYQEDEANTEAKTVLMMHIGGQQAKKSHGIHWHVDPKFKIRYLSDLKRENIYDVQLTKSDGSQVVFKTESKPKAGEKLEWRSMDCVDCHNRPTHVFHAPKDEIDLAMAEGKIDRSLPFVRKQGLEILKANYPDDRGVIQSEMLKKLNAFYQEKYPLLLTEKSKEIQGAAATLADVYSKNIFPKMNVKWGSYINHLGHENSPGCQRCHDGSHKSSAGLTISDDCESCHMVLANEEVNPKILVELGQ